MVVVRVLKRTVGLFPVGVDEPAWVAQRDQVRAALHRTWLPVYGGTVRAALVADRLALVTDRLGGAR